jgi:hypothetical protein
VIAVAEKDDLYAAPLPKDFSASPVSTSMVKE